jgi:hypothetical protein
MLQRLDAMESELGALIESLRTGSNRLNADLQLLESSLGEVREAVVPRPRFEPEPQAPVASHAIASNGEPAAHAEPPPGLEPMPPEPELEPVGVDQSAGADAGSEDAEGARLIALNMALNGTPREETDRYLAENFELSDRDRLLDEVYASVEG